MEKKQNFKSDEFILVLGSGSKTIPKIKVEEIYSSNGSAEIAALYKKKYPNITHTCVIAARSFLKLDHVKPRVAKAKPEKILIRDYENTSYDLVKKIFNSDIAFLKYSRKDQFYFQGKFFKSGLIDLLVAEVFYEKSFFKKFRHIYSFFASDVFLGVSSGFFAILYALQKNPDKKIIISGISFEGGKHYYSSGMMSYNRGRVDNYLINRLKKNIKEKIFVLDKDLSVKFGLRYLDLN